MKAPHEQTVADLIATLQQFPQDAVVLIGGFEDLPWEAELVGLAAGEVVVEINVYEAARCFNCAEPMEAGDEFPEDRICSECAGDAFADSEQERMNQMGGY